MKKIPVFRQLKKKMYLTNTLYGFKNSGNVKFDFANTIKRVLEKKCVEQAYPKKR